MIRSSLHILAHFLVPGIVARLGFKQHWRKAWLVMCLTILVDLDHVIADPVYDPDRCSIGFHPLHSYLAIAVYIVLLFFPKTRITAIGLLWHMITDGLDCAWMKWIN